MNGTLNTAALVYYYGTVTISKDGIVLKTLNNSSAYYSEKTVSSGAIELTAGDALRFDYSVSNASYSLYAYAKLTSLTYELAETPVVTHTITATAGANGAITPSGAVTVEDGQS